MGKGKEDTSLILHSSAMPVLMLARGRISGAAHFAPGTSQKKGNMNKVGIAAFMQSSLCRKC